MDNETETDDQIQNPTSSSSTRDETEEIVSPNNSSNYGTLSKSTTSTKHANKDNKTPIQEHQLQINKSSSSSSIPPKEEEEEVMHPLTITTILSTSFAYGLIVTTTFLVILPLECERIESDHSYSSSLLYSKSISLAFFVSLAGIIQLVSPLIGLMSDHICIPEYYPDNVRVLGRRLPYLLLGTTFTTFGLVGQIYTSIYHLWGRYILSYIFNILGLTVLYSVMIALIPDLIPEQQIGTANGTWALLLVLGSLIGFGLFHGVLEESLRGMYGVYAAVLVGCTVLTCVRVVDVLEEEEINKKKRKRVQDVEVCGQKNEEEKNNEKESLPLLSSSSSSPKQTQTQTQTKENNNDNISLLDILRTMLLDPIQDMSCTQIRSSYTISPTTHFDFLIVTISRTFYYMALSNQSFFLYFVHDVIGEHSNPEAAVSLLAIVGQMAGAVTCYPVGFISDLYCGGRRRPFVYVSCVILALGEMALLFCRDMTQMIVVCAVMGGANGVYLTMDTSLAVDTLGLEEEEEEKDGRDEKDGEEGQCINEEGRQEEGGEGMKKEKDDSGAAQLLGVWGVADFIGSALGPLVGGPLLYIFGTIPSTTTATTTAMDEYSESFDASSFNVSNIETTTTTVISTSNGAWYAFEGYAAIMTMSAIYSLCSAISLLFIRKTDV